MTDGLPTTTLAIFGISGDLSKRKLLPALAEICENSEIKASLNILGISRRDINKADVITQDATSLDQQLSLLKMDYSVAEEYEKLKDRLNELGSEQVIFYFAVPPSAVLPIVEHLGQGGLNTDRYKLLMEKPFGTDLKSAGELITQTDKYFNFQQVYRIDHFLAKEMAQNITVFLGSNALFREVWNNKFIEKIEIVAEESLGVEGRGNFYEQTGALRDFVQSHLLQLAALTLMEQGNDSFDFTTISPRRLDALNQLEVDTAKPIDRAQYKGYAEEIGNPKSSTETFVSFSLKSSSPKWVGVPIQLSTGKSMARKLTEIRVYFKKSLSAQTNLLKLRIQPQEAIELDLWVKKPGYEQNLQKLPLDFSYKQHFDRLPDAYEQVIVDAVRSRANLFASSDEVLASWKILQPVLDIWANDKTPIKIYEPGSHIADVDSLIQA